MAGKDDYFNLGFQVLPSAIPSALIEEILGEITRNAKDLGMAAAHSQDPSLVQKLRTDPKAQSTLYTKMRDHDIFNSIAEAPGLVEKVAPLFDGPIGVYNKVPLRIDVPGDTSQLSPWHQDYFYVRGSTKVITAWIPLQDTAYENGCLLVMPESHKLGPVEHDISIEKRSFPSTIFDRTVRYVEMKKGDVLIFHSCLLHCSGINISNSIRYSLQPRFALVNDSHDPDMLGLKAISS